jgi:hypothetical protein
LEKRRIKNGFGVSRIANQDELDYEDEEEKDIV